MVGSTQEIVVPFNWWPVLRPGELVAYLTEEEYVELLDDAFR